MKMEPKRRQLELRRRGITQKGTNYIWCKIYFSFLHIFRNIPSDKYLVCYVLVTYERCSLTHADCHVKYLLSSVNQNCNSLANIIKLPNFMKIQSAVLASCCEFARIKATVSEQNICIVWVMPYSCHGQRSNTWYDSTYNYLTKRLLLCLLTTNCLFHILLVTL